MRLVMLLVASCGAKSDQPVANAAAKADEVGAASKDELVQRVVDAIKTKSTPNLVSLHSTFDVIERLCPENVERDGRDEVARRIKDREPAYGAAIDECWRIGDLSGVTIESTTDEVSRSLDHCKDKSTIGTSLVQLKAGDKQLAVMLKWMRSSAGHAYLDIEPHCEPGSWE